MVSRATRELSLVRCTAGELVVGVEVGRVAAVERGDRLAKRPEYHLVPNAGHFDFLPPCNPAMTASNPDLCVSRPGFDRAAFHTQFNREVVRFFRQTL